MRQRDRESSILFSCNAHQILLGSLKEQSGWGGLGMQHEWGNNFWSQFPFRKSEIEISRKIKLKLKKKAPWSESARELYRPSDRRLSANLVPIFADRRCCVVNATDRHGRILSFLDRTRYFSFQVAPQLYSRSWVDPVPDLLFLRKFDSAENRTRNLT
jgi:hypothetical protein